MQCNFHNIWMLVIVVFATEYIDNGILWFRCIVAATYLNMNGHNTNTGCSRKTILPGVNVINCTSKAESPNNRKKIIIRIAIIYFYIYIVLNLRRATSEKCVICQCFKIINVSFFSPTKDMAERVPGWSVWNK